MISVFTPTHNPRFLKDCADSLEAQTYKNWEWIIVFNGEARYNGDPLPDNVRMFNAPEHVTGVGGLKSYACSQAQGDILVELDHDDILHPFALEEIAKAFEENPEASLVYSDFAQINADGTPDFNRFGPAYGWEYTIDSIGPTMYERCMSMPHFPSAMSYIWFAPNHVRAFKTETYNAVGGYNPNLDILDDQDLMNRLYRKGDFYHIDKLLYLQRVHDDNTQSKSDLNARIQIETVQLYDENIEANVLAWADRNGLAALDLGGAHNSPDDYVSVDLHDADLVGDVFEVLDGLEPNSVGVIRAHDFLEHISDRVRLFNSMYRVLAHGGMILSMTPSTDGRGAFQDPTHVSFYNENAFWYFTDLNLANYVPEIQCRFQSTRLYTFFPSEWHEQNKICYVVAHLTAIKDGAKIAGVVNI